MFLIVISLKKGRRITITHAPMIMRRSFVNEYNPKPSKISNRIIMQGIIHQHIISMRLSCFLDWENSGWFLVPFFMLVSPLIYFFFLLTKKLFSCYNPRMKILSCDESVALFMQLWNCSNYIKAYPKFSNAMVKFG